MRARLDAIEAARAAGEVARAADLTRALAADLKVEARDKAPAARNRERIADAALRAAVDPTFEQLHDALETAYYQYWRRGISHPWQGYDVQPTLEESKRQFDALHGALFHEHEVALAIADEARPVERRRPAHRRTDADGRSRREASQEWLRLAADRGIRVIVGR